LTKNVLEMCIEALEPLLIKCHVCVELILFVQ
jgi:hypothetical protein